MLERKERGRDPQELCSHPSMAAKMGSFRHSLAEKRERLLSTTKCYSEIVFPNIQEDLDEPTRNCCSYRFLSDKIVGLCKQVQDVAYRGYQMGKSDPRKIVFSAKMGLALMLISLLIFLKEPIKELSQHFVWAILTVVVVFEFSIGKFDWFLCPFLFLVFVCMVWLILLYGLLLNVCLCVSVYMSGVF